MTALIQVVWSTWDDDDIKKQPRRVCSVAGCKSVPDWVRTIYKDGGKARRHVYCDEHESVGRKLGVKDV